ncbi:MAG: hypothetical protein EON61_03185 [Alphaproteobacteria bacterium]|nr:MAG: hypothetical protein EON61_03185 [Alphaproteobacteria bacterium]
MNALWQIILRILWRLRPVTALEVNLHDVVEIGFAMFTHDHAFADVCADPKRLSRLAAAMGDSHAKLNLLIYLRACEIAGITPRNARFIPNFTHTHASTDPLSLWRSFERLVAKFDDYEHLAAKRAARLKREATPIPPSLRDSPLRLDAAHQSTSPARRAVEDTTAALSPPSRDARGRWIARSRAQDGGGCASSRGRLHATGPPFSVRLPIVDRQPPRRLTCEIAPSRPQTKRPPLRAAFSISEIN